MPIAPPAENSKKSEPKVCDNLMVRLLPEAIAIQEFTQKVLQSPKKPKLTFLEWLSEGNIKLINLPDSSQFWLKKQLLLAKS
jgi:hypothetical protein